jgi:PAS domain S-box-containing protein
MYSALYRVMLAVGWITFAVSVSSPFLHRLEWRYEIVFLFLGPVLIFGGLIVRYCKGDRPAIKSRSSQKIPVATNWACGSPVGLMNNRLTAQNIDARLVSTHLIGAPQRTSPGIISGSPKHMMSLERVWERRNRTAVLLVSGAIILAVAVVDWWTKPYVSLGFIYLFPIMLAAGLLPRWAIALLGFVCAILAEIFSSLDRSFIRLFFETLALAGCGLFVAELVRNRRMSLEAQERLRALVETSPAAIVTVNERGVIELANRAAAELMAPRDGHLVGNPIAAFLPELHHALRWEEAPRFRASMQCRGYRGNGELFTADIWFSTYKEGPSPKLAAIIGDVSDETRAALNSNGDGDPPPLA